MLTLRLNLLRATCIRLLTCHAALVFTFATRENLIARFQADLRQPGSGGELIHSLPLPDRRLSGGSSSAACPYTILLICNLALTNTHRPLRQKRPGICARSSCDNHPVLCLLKAIQFWCQTRVLSRISLSRSCVVIQFL